MSEPKTSKRSLFLLSGYINCLQTRHEKLLAALGINLGGFSQIVISLVATMLSNGIVSEVCEKIRETGMPWATAMPPISVRYICRKSKRRGVCCAVEVYYVKIVTQPDFEILMPSLRKIIIFKK